MAYLGDLQKRYCIEEPGFCKSQPYAQLYLLTFLDKNKEKDTKKNETKGKEASSFKPFRYNCGESDNDFEHIYDGYITDNFKGVKVGIAASIGNDGHYSVQCLTKNLERKDVINCVCSHLPANKEYQYDRSTK